MPAVKKCMTASKTQAEEEFGVGLHHTDEPGVRGEKVETYNICGVSQPLYVTPEITHKTKS